MGQQRLTTSEVEAATRHLTGGTARARLLEQKDRNQVFAVGERAIFKAYPADRAARQGRKVAALEFLAGGCLPVRQLRGHGILPNGVSGVPWTREARVSAGHARPSRGELDTPWGWELNRALGRWLPALHAFGGFPRFGTWEAAGPATLAGHVLPPTPAVPARAAGVAGVPPALVRPAGQDRGRRHPFAPRRPA